MYAFASESPPRPTDSRDPVSESASLGRDLRNDWQHARTKTAIGNLTQAWSPPDELGKAGFDAKGWSPNANPVDGASVVVRDRESRLHGEGRQFK